MKHFPNHSIYKKPHKIKNFKGAKGFLLGNYTVGARLHKTQYITYEQLEAIRRAITRLVKPKAKKRKRNPQAILKTKNLRLKKRKKPLKKFLILRSTLSLSLTKKPLNVRMGKGAGNIDKWVHPAASSKIILELSRRSFITRRAFKLYKQALKKFPYMNFTYSKTDSRRENRIKII